MNVVIIYFPLCGLILKLLVVVKLLKKLSNILILFLFSVMTLLCVMVSCRGSSFGGWYVLKNNVFKNYGKFLPWVIKMHLFKL